MTPAELAEKLEGICGGFLSPLSPGDTEAVRQAAALISAQAAEIARLEEAAGEVWDEAYNEGACDTAGWEKETAHAVLQWLDKEGDGFDINHPDGNTTDAIIQGLYDAKRSGNLAELRQAAARLRSMEEALKKIASGEYEEYDEELRCPVLVPMDGEIATDIARAALSGEKQ